MKMDRRAFIAGAIALSGAPLAAEAQQPAKVYRIGWLGQSVSSSYRYNSGGSLGPGIWARSPIALDPRGYLVCRHPTVRRGCDARSGPGSDPR